MIVAIDCGNTRLKWARFEAGRPSGRGGAMLRGEDDPFARLAASLDGVSGPVLVANVAGDVVGRRITASVESALGRKPEFIKVAARAHGIVCAYRNPAALGVDRWLAMIAARRRLTGAFAVISAGTLVTVDAVDGAGRHLGGLIVPSDRLMIEAMAQNAEQISTVEPSVGEALPNTRKRAALSGRLLGESSGEGRARPTEIGW